MTQIESDELRRLIKEGQRLTNEHNRQFAMNLLGAGFSIIPAEWLGDNQIIVSQRVYDAIKAAGGCDEP